MQPIECKHCGAVMTPGADGRTYTCAYCRSTVQVAIDAGQLAAGMAFDATNVETSMAHLAQTLMQGLAEHTRVQYTGQWVHKLEVDLGSDRFVAAREGRDLVTRHQKMVRGVAIKNAPIPIDRWFETLTQAIAREANANAKAAWVLGQMGGGKHG
jgi:hypothetical protein